MQTFPETRVVMTGIFGDQCVNWNHHLAKSSGRGSLPTSKWQSNYTVQDHWGRTARCPSLNFTGKPKESTSLSWLNSIVSPDASPNKPSTWTSIESGKSEYDYCKSLKQIIWTKHVEPLWTILHLTSESPNVSCTSNVSWNCAVRPSRTKPMNWNLTKCNTNGSSTASIVLVSV